MFKPYMTEMDQLEGIRYAINEQLQLIKEQNHRNPANRTPVNKMIACILIARLRTVQEEIEKLEFEAAFKELEIMRNQEEPANV